MDGYIPPFAFILCRVLGAVIFFWGCSALFPNNRLQAKDIGRLILCGMFGVACNQLCFFEGLDNTVPINASVIMTVNPILVLIISFFVLRERITIRKSIGIAVGLAGAVTMLMFKGDSITTLQFGSDTVYGDLLILVNATSYGIYLVIVKPLMSRYHPVQVVKWVFTFGTLFVLPFGLPQIGEVMWETFDAVIWWEFAFVVIGVTCFAYLFNIYALKHVNPTVVSTYIYLQPVLASIFAIMMQTDTLTAIKVGAAMLIMLGVYLVSSRRNAGTVKQS